MNSLNVGSQSQSTTHSLTANGNRLLIGVLALSAGLAACGKKEAPAGDSAAKLATAQKAVAAGKKAKDNKAAIQTAAAAVPAAPNNLMALTTPKDNPTTPAKVALGRQLFFDKSLSVDGTRACYSCHQNEDGTGGHDPTAIGAKNKPLSRHAPSLWNVAYLPRLYWDGRAGSLEAQAKGAWAGGNMGVGKDNLMDKADDIGEKPEYKAQFNAVFPGVGASPDTIAQAISAYERTLFCADTAFDKFFAGDTSALNDEQKAGKDVFIGKGGCHSCHTPPMFSDAYVNGDGAYHNVGVGIDGKDESAIDVGRVKVSDNPSEWAAFKTPSLRNVSKTAPYFHDGSIAKLEDAVRFMARGGHPNKGLDQKMMDKKLSDKEIEQLVAFLGSLDCNGTLSAK